VNDKVPIQWRSARRAQLALERMNPSRKYIRLVFCLMLCAPVWLARAHTLPDADSMVTLELAVRDVEKLAGQIGAILDEHGFTKVSSMPRMTVDGYKLPPSASVGEGIIFARFEDESGLSVSVHVTVCRATFMMWLPDGVDKTIGQRQLRSTEAILVTGLSTRKDVPVTVTDGVGVSENPCDPAVGANNHSAAGT
jgi:hypothetical protein